MERDNDTADSDVSRRNVLKTTGALGALAVGAGLGTSSAAAAPNTEPETVEAPYEVRLGDGDVLANKRIVANGSRVSIVANGSDWEIRNVGIEGKADSNPIAVKVPDSGGSGLIENVYVGGVSTPDETPIFVHREHAGTVTIRHVNVGNAPKTHGIYAAPPGSPSWRKQGAGGAVQIESCYAHDLGWNGFRIGTDGSYVKDSVAENCGHSGVWNQWQEGRVENVRITSGVNALNCGANNYDNRDGECKLYAENVEYDSPNEIRKAPGIGDWKFYYPSNVSASSSVDTSPPSGVPMSASEAANGGGSGGSGGSSGSGDSGSSDDSDSSDSSDASDDADRSEESSGSEESSESSDSEESTSGSTVSVDVTASESNDGAVEYELQANGTFAESRSDDSNDRADGSRASGKVWPGFTDTFPLDGELTGASATGEVTITVDGEPVDVGTDAQESGSSGDSENSDDSSGDDSSDSTDAGASEDGSSDSSDSATGGDRSLVVQGTGSTTDGPRAYEAVVEGGTISDLEGNADDTVSDDGTEVSGKVWAPFTDRYSFGGELASFETDGPVEVRVDGETIDPDSLS